MALDQDMDRLAQVPLFQTFDTDALRLLAFSGETRIVPADAALFSRGEASDAGYLVLSGAFRVTDDHGDAAKAGPGSLLAEAALLRDMVHTSSAVAESTATVFKLPRKAVRRVLEEHPATAGRMLAFLARRLHAALPRDVAER